MSRKTKARTRRAKAKTAVTSGRRRRFTKAVIVVLVLCVASGGAALTGIVPVRRLIGLAPAPEPAAQQGNLSLSKEYIYAGGRLVATEEPTPATGPPPTSFEAISTSTISATSVSLSWTAPTGNISQYMIERSLTLSGFSQVGTSPSTQTSFIDTTAAADTAYLYRVKAAYTGGGSSTYSDTDLATTVVFTDATLAGVAIKATHLNEARRAVNAVRALTGLGAASWTHADPVSSPPAQRRAIYLVDMNELRTNLNPALTALGITQLPTDPTLAQGSQVKATHIEVVREKVE